MQSNLALLGKRDIALVALSVDDVPAGKRLAEKLSLGFPLLSDPKAESLKAFGVFDPQNEIAWPAIFVIARDAASPTGKVAHRWLADTYSERIATAAVLEALEKP